MSVLRFDPFGDPFRQMDRLTNQLLSGTRTPMGMPMDVWQADDGFHVSLDLPGVDPSSVDISTERSVLTITAERRPEYQQGHNVLVAERPQGSFTRQLQLGDTVDSENVQATYADGVLHLSSRSLRLPSRAGFKCRPAVAADVRSRSRPSRRKRLAPPGSPPQAIPRRRRREARRSSSHDCWCLESTALRRRKRCSTWQALGRQADRVAGDARLHAQRWCSAQDHLSQSS